MHKLQHYLRYGNSTDTKFLKKYQNDASTIVFNANILCHHTKNVTELIHVDLLEKDYIIDPRTYVFQMDLKSLLDKNGQIRSSYKKLANEYKLPTFIIDDKKNISKQNLNNINLKKLTKDTLKFQSNFLFDNLDEDIKVFMKRSKKNKKPKFLISPYFLNFDTSWINENIFLIEESLKYKKDFNNNIYAILVIDKDTILNKKSIKTIIEKYSIADGLIFWINDFNEQNVSQEEIDALIEMIQFYKKLNPYKEIISLYGGYFSQLLYHCGLNGVCHNLEYGETRNVNPSNARPTHKYYLPAVKQRIDPFEMIKILSNHKLTTKEDFYQKICDCNICIKNINTNQIQEKFFVYLHDKDPEKTLELSRENCICHYLENKTKEFKHIVNNKLELLINELENTYQEYKQKDYLLGTNKVNIEYIIRWVNALSKYTSGS